MIQQGNTNALRLSCRSRNVALRITESNYDDCTEDQLLSLDISTLRGDWTIFFFILKFSFFLLHCVPLYVCRLCINYQDLSANLLGVAALVCCFSPSLHAL